MTTPGRIETCRLHEAGFAMLDGESTVDLVERYSRWRDEHMGCVLPEPERPTEPVEPGAAVEG